MILELWKKIALLPMSIVTWFKTLYVKLSENGMVDDAAYLISGVVILCLVGILIYIIRRK